MNINLERLHEALEHYFHFINKINKLEMEKEETTELVNDIEEEIKWIIKEGMK